FCGVDIKCLDLGLHRGCIRRRSTGCEIGTEPGNGAQFPSWNSGFGNPEIIENLGGVWRSFPGILKIADREKIVVVLGGSDSVVDGDFGGGGEWRRSRVV